MAIVNEKKTKSTNMDLSRFLEFSLGKSEYAIPLLIVKEVLSIPSTTPIPNSPAYFMGLMNLRGQVISIIDLRKKMKVSPKEHNEEAVIIVDLDGLNIGVVVDSINNVLAFSSEEVSEMPDVDSQLQSHYIAGVYKKAHSLTVLLDVAQVLDLKDLELVSKHKSAA